MSFLSDLEQITESPHGVVDWPSVREHVIEETSSSSLISATDEESRYAELIEWTLTLFQWDRDKDVLSTSRFVQSDLDTRSRLADLYRVELTEGPMASHEIAWVEDGFFKYLSIFDQLSTAPAWVSHSTRMCELTSAPLLELWSLVRLSAGDELSSASSSSLKVLIEFDRSGSANTAPQQIADSEDEASGELVRQNVARTFVSLGRRNQNLLNRQLEFIDELEQQETDADALQNLYRLDHLATRMRRNAENLLVLAGEQTPRRWGKPIAVRDVLRAAASEIADYRRVRLKEIDVATVSGNLATDLSHLIAELLENAGSFSPPNEPIEVLGQHNSTHYRLAIVDHGIGMDAQALAQVNDRLKNPVDFADAPSAYLGLFVVGRLAQGLGITVRLASADPTEEGHRRGTIAFIDLPVSLLSSDVATPLEIPKRGGASIDKKATEAASASPLTAPAPQTAAPMPIAAEQGEAPKRDAAEVSNSLRSIRAAVARGRAGRETGEAPAAPTPSPTTSAGFPKGSLSDAHVQERENTLRHHSLLFGPDDRDTLLLQHSLAVAYEEVGRWDEAVSLYERTIAKHIELFGPDDRGTLALWNNLAVTYEKMGRWDEAVSLYERTIAKHIELFGPDDRDVRVLRKNLSIAYRRLQRDVMKR